MHYKILQLKDKNCYRFMDYDYAQEHNFSIDDYTIVYEDEYTNFKEHDEEYILEDLFMLFNVRRPQDFQGYSLSVSDIIELDGVKYYCETCGWRKLK